MVDEKLISPEEALERVEPMHLQQLLVPAANEHTNAAIDMTLHEFMTAASNDLGFQKQIVLGKNKTKT